MLSEKEKIELITRISLELNETKDIDHLLERLLTSGSPAGETAHKREKSL